MQQLVAVQRAFYDRADRSGRCEPYCCLGFAALGARMYVQMPDAPAAALGGLRDAYRIADQQRFDKALLARGQRAAEGKRIERIDDGCAKRTRIARRFYQACDRAAGSQKAGLRIGDHRFTAWRL